MSRQPAWRLAGHGATRGANPDSQSTVNALIVLVLLPLLVGVAAEALFREPRRASLVAVVATAVLTCLAVQVLDRGDSWNWIAGLMVLPLSIALAVAATLLCDGRFDPPRHARRDMP
jgi:hypothetical protein